MARLVIAVEFFHNFRILGTVKHTNRYLNTSTTKLNPRGLRISREAQISEDESQENLTQLVDECHSESDRLKCPSADPVVLKYTNFVNSLRKGQIQEKVYDTQFGKVRFDKENVPVVHGQFDSNVSEERVSKQVNEFYDRKINQESTSFDDNIKEMNFVDEVWFGESYRNYKGISDTDKVSKISGNAPSIHSDLNFIDEGIFGEAYAATTNHNDESLHDKNTYVNQGDAKDSTDHGFIDQVYFKESLDMMNENKQLCTDFSTIKTDFENAILDIDDENEIKSEKLYTEENFQKLNYLDSANKNLNNANISEVSVNITKIKDFYLNPTSSSAVKTDFEMAIIESDIENKDELSNFSKKFEGQSNVVESSDNHSLSKEDGISHNQILATTEFSKTKIMYNQRGDNKENDGEKNETAYDYVLKMRKTQEQEESNKIDSDKSTQKNFDIIINSVQNMDEMSNYDVLKLLKQSILYDKYDIVGLYKPYGMAMHPGTTGSKHVLFDYLESLAKALKVPKLYTLHRLDVQTTGVLLLAKTPEMAEKLKEMFKNRHLTKTYMAITKGIPSKKQGILDIPIAEGMIEGRRRMALRPNIEGLKNPRGASKQAITKYKVLSSVNSSSLIEVVPVTGVKHQIRVHLGFGLATPVLGDHKYSHLKKLAPQRLSGDILEHLQMPQSRVRKLPMFLHAKSIFIPEVIDGRNVSIQAALPPYFTKAIKMLELHRSKNKVEERFQNTVTVL